MVSWQTTAADLGPHTIEIHASDPRGGVGSQVFVLNVAEAADHPPTIVSVPPASVLVGDTYAYAVVGDDPDGDALAYRLTQAPAGMTIDAASGEIAWPTDGVFPGDFLVSVVADDGRGGTSTQTFTVRVDGAYQNGAPVISSRPALSLLVGRDWRYAVVADDPDGDPLTYAVVEGPDALTLDGNVLSWTPTAEDAGSHRVVVVVSDGRGGSSRQSFLVTVAPDSVGVDLTPPTLTVSTVAAEPNGFTTVLISASDASGPSLVTLTVAGVPYEVAGADHVTIPTGDPGSYPVVATATDDAGNTTTVRTWIDVRDASDGVAPTAAIASPAAGAELSVATDIVGTADDANLSRWALTATPASPAGSEPIILAEGTDPVVDGLLGTVDPSVLAGGEWAIRLEVTDTGGSVSGTGFVVTSVNEAKYGLFSLTFTDAVLPVAGMPIAVQRTYDSGARSRLGDFGFGWDLGIQSLRLETDNAPGDGWIRENHGTFLPNWVLVPTQPHTVTVVDGANRSIVFDFTPTFIDPIADGRFATAAWTERTHTGATLEPVDTVDLVQSDGTLLSLDTVEEYAPPSYVLTMPDGRQFTFSLEDGMTKARDANGNTLTISASGITSSTGASVAFDRDDEGRIAAVTTPSGLVTRYAYDADGNLSAVDGSRGQRHDVRVRVGPLPDRHRRPARADTGPQRVRRGRPPGRGRGRGG